MSLRLIVSAPSEQPTTDAAYRAELVTRYVTARDWSAELAFLAEAARYDRDNPVLPSLADELYGTRLHDAA